MGTMLRKMCVTFQEDHSKIWEVRIEASDDPAIECFSTCNTHLRVEKWDQYTIETLEKNLQISTGQFWLQVLRVCFCCSSARHHEVRRSVSPLSAYSRSRLCSTLHSTPGHSKLLKHL